MAERRIAALILPHFLCEIAAESLLCQPGQLGSQRLAVAVVLCESRTGSRGSASQLALTAVNDVASRLGLAPGQTVAEAKSRVHQLRIVELTHEQVSTRLVRVAESLANFSPELQIQFPETLWLDITGSIGQYGSPDEPALARERNMIEQIAAKVRELGHASRLAVSTGPLLARAFARYGAFLGPNATRWSEVRASEFEEYGRGRQAWVIPTELSPRLIRELPIVALPVPTEIVAWLAKLGMLTIADLVEIPRITLGSRLGEHARVTLDFMAGKDEQPLTPCQFEETLQEQLQWEDAVEGIEPLLFVARRLVRALCARLGGRGVGILSLKLEVQGDSAVARLQRVPSVQQWRLDFAGAIATESELQRIVATKLGAESWVTPSVGLKLVVEKTGIVGSRQLSLTSKSTEKSDLIALCSELSIELGSGEVGCFEIGKSHRPERQGVLVPFSESKRHEQVKSSASRPDQGARVTVLGPPSLAGAPSLQGPLGDRASVRAPAKLLDPPLAVAGELRLRSLLLLSQQAYWLERLLFVYRLDFRDWSDGTRIIRDYFEVSLKSNQDWLEGLLYLDHRDGGRYLQGIFD